MVMPFKSVSVCNDPDCPTCSVHGVPNVISSVSTDLRLSIAASVVGAMSRRWRLSASERRTYEAALNVIATHLGKRS